MTGAGIDGAGRSSVLGVLGAGLWIAWITIIYSADDAFPAGVDLRQAAASSFLFSTLSLGATLIVLSSLPALARRLMCGRVLAALSCVGAVATLLVMNPHVVSPALFVAAAAATGCVTALVALRAALVFSEIETRAMLIGMGASLLLGVLVYALDMMLVLCGLHAQAVAILMLLIPLAVFCLCPAGAPLEGESEVAPGEDATVRVPLSGRLKHLIAFIAMLLFLLSLTRGYYPNLIDASQFATSRCMVALGLVAVAVAFAAMACSVPRNAAFGTIFYGLLLFSVLSALVLALLNVSPTVMGDVSSVLFGVTMLCLWGLLCRVCFRSGARPIQVVGVGFGVACLATTAGVGAGVLIYEAGMPTGLLGFVMAAAVIACVGGALFLLRLDDVRALMEPAQDGFADDGLGGGAADSPISEPAPSSARAASPIAASAAEALAGAAEERPSASALDGYQALLQRSCALMAFDYDLSTREVDVLELLVVGKDAKAIADELFISFNTVRSHIRRIYVKLDVHSRQELLDKVKHQAH